MAESTSNITEGPNQWSEIITPRGDLLDLRLREVWRYRDLLLLFVKRDLSAQYKQTILGPLWYIIQPIFTTIVFLILFSKIAGIKTGDVPPAVFYMSGISIWNYFQFCFNGTASTFTANAGIFGKVYFPRLVMPLAIVASNIFKFGIQLGLLVAVMLYYVIAEHKNFSIGFHTLLLPLVIIVMAGIGLGTGIIISSLTTKYRDLSILIGFGVQLLMYLTPVAYPLSYVAAKHPKYQTAILLNPLSSLVETFRYAILGKGEMLWGWLGYSSGFMLVVLFIGAVIFNRVERTFMDTV